MDIHFATRDRDQADSIAFVVRKSESANMEKIAASIAEYGEILAVAARQNRFEGGAGKVIETAALKDGRGLRLLLVGAGDGKRADHERAGGSLVARLQTSGDVSVSVDFSAAGTVSESDILEFAMGAKLRSWRHDRYRTQLPASGKPSLERVIFLSSFGDLASRWGSCAAVSAGVALTQSLVAEPGNVIYPKSFVEECRHLSALGIVLEVLDDRQMKELGMGALLGVAQGSSQPARMLAMRWNGGSSDSRPVAFIGKGVTFDTGGISLKPGPGMEMMKWDMGGAGAVAGAMKALAGRKAKANVVGICALAENMPGSKAQRPGDIVTSMSGKTIEVLNTDAEGRLILCDAIHWAQEVYQPEVIIDLATLTGAMVIALGHEYAGLFSNDEALAEQLLAAGEASGNKLWRFPLSEAYNKLIDSSIADMKNIGPREAGSITAAQFLQRFVKEGVKWAHLDIAGMAWDKKAGAVWGKGATGYGVRLLDRFIADNFEH